MCRVAGHGVRDRNMFLKADGRRLSYNTQLAMRAACDEF